MPKTISKYYKKGSMTKKFIYGQYCYQYTFIPQNRKTLSLTVRPDMKIILKAPVVADQDRINLFLRRKWLWLNKQLNFFKKYKKTIYKKEYISGESFLYLGRQYKLLVKNNNKDGVFLTKGIFYLNTAKKVNNGEHNKKILDNWYKQKIEIKFNQRYKHVFNNFNYKFVPKLVIRKMKKRWGSFLKKKQIILNPKLIQASTDCIDYVITHELCHMRYKKHSKQFYSFLNSKYPSWENVKEKLELKIG